MDAFSIMVPDNQKKYMANETHSFQTEVHQLLDIVIHALYSDREIFIRELVSNASDALEKLRLKQLTGASVCEPERELRISVKADEESRRVEISDSGIGMTREEAVENLGTIAHSGTKKFLEALQEGSGAKDLIGQFGVGFYSSFMVAEKVEVFSRSWESEAAPIHWTSDGRDGYSIDDAPADTPRGTRVVLHLQEAYKEFAEKNRVRLILERYSNFVAFPIDVDGEHLNTVQAIWMKSKKEVTPEEYEQFYQFITHTEGKALTHMHFSADAPIALNALLYVPSENPEMWGLGRTEPDVALYCHRVLIDAKPEGLLPEWLRFLHGVVDSEDLPLNISREMLQDSSIIRKINEVVTNRFLKHLDKIAADDAELYDKIYAQFSRYIKEGLITSWQHKEPLGKLLRMESTFTEAGKRTSLADYVSRMKENQKDIYVLFGSSRAQLEHSPYLDALKSRGFEVLFLTDSGDQFVVDSLSSFDGKSLKSIDRADLDLPDLPEDASSPGLSAEEGSALSSWLETLFPGRFSKVAVGDRADSTPAIALQGENDLAPEVRSYMQAMGQTVPESHPQLMLNPKNDLVQKLSTLRTSEPELAGLVAGQIVNTALLRAGLLEDPSQLAENSQTLLEKLLK